MFLPSSTTMDATPQPPENDSSKSSMFPSTMWTDLSKWVIAPTELRQAISNEFYRNYRSPLLAFIIAKYRLRKQDAEDFLHGFIEKQIYGDKSIFKSANREKGRFRNFLRTAINNHIRTELRNEKTIGKRPKEGLIPLDQPLGDGFTVGDIVQGGSTPEEVFDRAWLTTLLLKSLKRFKKKCGTKKLIHFELYMKRVIKPILHDLEKPSVKKLAHQYGLTVKGVYNRTREIGEVFNESVEEEIGEYLEPGRATSEEKDDLLKFLGRFRRYRPDSG